MIDEKKGIGIFIAAILAISVLAAMTPAASAVCNDGSVNVAFVPNPDGDNGGTLPTTHSAFNKFTFTNVPIASVNATTLANFDTVVLVTVCDPMIEFTASQRSDIVNWAANGGKLIIYDSECKENGTVDYSWLPCKATSFSPGAWGATKAGYPWVDLSIVEDNTLSDNNPASPYFINTTKIAYETDAVGDQNVFKAKDPCWCADMEGTNVLNAAGQLAAPGTTGYSHAYTHYSNGLIIYNGLDINFLSAGDDPTADTGVGHLAKIWLLELNQTWDNVTGMDLCDLPCHIIITPTPAPAPVPAITPIGIIALVGLLSGIAAMSISISIKKRRQ
jgi:hypothetical protein